MFGLGRKKIHLGQASRLLTKTLLEIPDTDYSKFDEIRSNFNEGEIDVLNEELKFLKYICINFAFIIVAIEKRSNIDPKLLGQTVSYAMRLAFEDFGYEGEELEYYMGNFSDGFEYMIDDLESLSQVNRDTIVGSVANSFTKNLLESFSANTNSEKRIPLMFHSTGTIIGINNLMKDFLKQFKITELN
ncbi:hypothetical protein M3194_15630 [Paenibacillus glycanilyticus]|uniref:hypothetical protein n=1 Tax=Paenibacillus glycanilyticus TaxID=126569 RepID=UPI00204205DC|nr:hypothetical protein [Paenibacillus glycanilyticus]MCM3628774.1 hypothetical protein [Paenibacillus glycanilyticus]